MEQTVPTRIAYCPDADILEIGLGVNVETRAIPLDEQTFVHLNVETDRVVGFTIINCRDFAGEVG